MKVFQVKNEITWQLLYQNWQPPMPEYLGKTAGSICQNNHKRCFSLGKDASTEQWVVLTVRCKTWRERSKMERERQMNRSREEGGGKRTQIEFQF